jgi:hypothetical protein
MLFREDMLINDEERLEIENLFNIKISKERIPVPFDDGMHDIPTLKVDLVHDSGRAAMLLDSGWLSKDMQPINPNDAKLVWLDVREGCSKWHVKHFPQICRLTIEAYGLSNDELEGSGVQIVNVASTPPKNIYLFFKNTTSGDISIVHPFAEFAVSKALFTPEELASFQAIPSVPAAESDFDRFKKLFDRVGQKYTWASLTPGEAEQKGYRNNVAHGIALIPPTEDPPRLQRVHWRSLDEYTCAFYFDAEGKYVGTCTIPT